MPYDLFISYSRRDNEQGRITQLAGFQGKSVIELEILHVALNNPDLAACSL